MTGPSAQVEQGQVPGSGASAARPDGSPGRPVVRLVVVTYSPGDSLARLLASVPAATALPVEVVLADNGSTDGSPEAAVRPGVELLRTGGNLGYGRAANLGATGTDAAWLLIVNPDVVLGPGALDELLSAADRWPRAGALGPAILTPDGRLYPSAREFPSLARGTGHALFGWCWPANPWTAAYRRERDRPDERRAGWLSGSCVLVRREAFEAVGGFDPGYFMYCEDMDLCRRIGEAGHDVVYVPGSVVTHTGGHATRRSPRRMVVEHHRSLWRYLRRRYRGARYAPLRLLLAAGLAARALLAVVVPRVGEGAAPVHAADEVPAAGQVPAAGGVPAGDGVRAGDGIQAVEPDGRR